MSNLSTSAPIEYNGCQLAQQEQTEPFSLNIDFLKINFLNFQEIVNTKLFRFEKQGYGNKFFNDRYKVYWNEVEFGELIASPRSEILDSRLVQLKISNHNLYGAVDLYEGLADWVETMQMQFHSINRIDVAFDCHTLNGNTPVEIVQMWECGQILLKGRYKKYDTYKDVVNGKPKVTGYSWGTRENTERFLRIYNKSIEMQKREKPYILQEWEKCGLDTKKQDVYRVEIQLSNRFMNKYAFLWADLVKSKKTLVELLKLGVKNFFEFVVDAGHKETNKNPPFKLFDYEGLISQLKGVKHELIKLTKNVKTLSKRAQMITLKGLLRQYYQTYQTPIYAIVSREFIESNSLQKFFAKKLPDWLNEFMSSAIEYQFDQKEFEEHLKLEI